MANIDFGELENACITKINNFKADFSSDALFRKVNIKEFRERFNTSWFIMLGLRLLSKDFRKTNPGRNMIKRMEYPYRVFFQKIGGEKIFQQIDSSNRSDIHNIIKNNNQSFGISKLNRNGLYRQIYDKAYDLFGETEANYAEADKGDRPNEHINDFCTKKGQKWLMKRKQYLAKLEGKIEELKKLVDKHQNDQKFRALFRVRYRKRFFEKFEKFLYNTLNLINNEKERLEQFIQKIGETRNQIGKTRIQEESNPNEVGNKLTRLKEEREERYAQIIKDYLRMFYDSIEYADKNTAQKTLFELIDDIKTKKIEYEDVKDVWDSRKNEISNRLNEDLGKAGGEPVFEEKRNEILIDSMWKEGFLPEFQEWEKKGKIDYEIVKNKIASQLETAESQQECIEVNINGKEEKVFTTSSYGAGNLLKWLGEQTTGGNYKNACAVIVLKKDFDKPIGKYNAKAKEGTPIRIGPDCENKYFKIASGVGNEERTRTNPFTPKFTMDGLVDNMFNNKKEGLQNNVSSINFFKDKKSRNNYYNQLIRGETINTGNASKTDDSEDMDQGTWEYRRNIKERKINLLKEQLATREKEGNTITTFRPNTRAYLGDFLLKATNINLDEAIKALIDLVKYIKENQIKYVDVKEEWDKTVEEIKNQLKGQSIFDIITTDVKELEDKYKIYYMWSYFEREMDGWKNGGNLEPQKVENAINECVDKHQGYVKMEGIFKNDKHVDIFVLESSKNEKVSKVIDWVARKIYGVGDCNELNAVAVLKKDFDKPIGGYTAKVSEGTPIRIGPDCENKNLKIAEGVGNEERTRTNPFTPKFTMNGLIEREVLGKKIADFNGTVSWIRFFENAKERDECYGKVKNSGKDEVVKKWEDDEEARKKKEEEERLKKAKEEKNRQEEGENQNKEEKENKEKKGNKEENENKEEEAKEKEMVSKWLSELEEGFKKNDAKAIERLYESNRMPEVRMRKVVYKCLLEENKKYPNVWNKLQENIKSNFPETNALYVVYTEGKQFYEMENAETCEEILNEMVKEIRKDNRNGIEQLAKKFIDNLGATGKGDYTERYRRLMEKLLTQKEYESIRNYVGKAGIGESCEKLKEEIDSVRDKEQKTVEKCKEILRSLKEAVNNYDKDKMKELAEQFKKEISKFEYVFKTEKEKLLLETTEGGLDIRGLKGVQAEESMNILYELVKKARGNKKTECENILKSLAEKLKKGGEIEEGEVNETVGKFLAGLEKVGKIRTRELMGELIYGKDYLKIIEYLDKKDSEYENIKKLKQMKDSFKCEEQNTVKNCEEILNNLKKQVNEKNIPQIKEEINKLFSERDNMRGNHNALTKISKLKEIEDLEQLATQLEQDTTPVLLEEVKDQFNTLNIVQLVRLACKNVKDKYNKLSQIKQNIENGINEGHTIIDKKLYINRELKSIVVSDNNTLGEVLKYCGNKAFGVDNRDAKEWENSHIIITLTENGATKFADSIQNPQNPPKIYSVIKSFLGGVIDDAKKRKLYLSNKQGRPAVLHKITPEFAVKNFGTETVNDPNGMLADIEKIEVFKNPAPLESDRKSNGLEF